MGSKVTIDVLELDKLNDTIVSLRAELKESKYLEAAAKEMARGYNLSIQAQEEEISALRDELEKERQHLKEEGASWRKNYEASVRDADDLRAENERLKALVEATAPIIRYVKKTVRNWNNEYPIEHPCTKMVAELEKADEALERRKKGAAV